MTLDNWLSEEEFLKEANERVLQLVSIAKRECPDGVYPVEFEDFCDLLFNGRGYLVHRNKAILNGYFEHQLECLGSGFKCVTEEEFNYVIAC